MNLFTLGSWTWLWETINGLFLIISHLLYRLISLFYQVFDAVSKVNLFSEDIFKQFTSRIYVIMGIAMLFIFAYNIILLIINPDDKKNMGNAGKLVKEIIISLTLIILLPTIFRYMTYFQNHLLDSNIIGKVILNIDTGTSTTNCSNDDYDCHCDFSNFNMNSYTERNSSWFFGVKTNSTTDVSVILSDMCKDYRDNATDSEKGAYSVAPILMQSFYRPTEFSFDDCVKYLKGESSPVSNLSDESKSVCVNYFFDVTASRYKGDVSPFVKDSFLKNIVSDSSKDIMEFDWLLAVISGVVAAWMFLCYCLEVGVRAAKLGVLQIISPIPVMMRIIPNQKDGMFDKWFKHVKNAYIDIFIRLIIIYFCLFAISLVPEVIDNLFTSLWTNGQGNWFVKGLATVVIILGILKFGGDAPGLLKEFFGDSGAFAVKSPSKQLKENKLGGSALGMLGGAASSAAGNLFNAGRNIKNAKGWKKGMAIAKAPFAPISGAIGGAVRGAKNGYGANDFKDLGNKIAEAKYDTDAAYQRGVIGGVKHQAKKIGEGFGDFGRFISGEGATSFRLKAIEASLGDVQGVNANFKNATIDSIESSQGKMFDDYRLGKDLNFNGKDYKKVGDYWVNKNDSSDRIAHDDRVDKDNNMNKSIKEYFDNLKKSAYVSEFAKNEQAFERLTSKMISTLNENFPKIGQDIVKGINKNLADNGLDISFNNTDEITKKIGELMKDGNREAIYDINDALEKNLKNVKKNEIIAQQEKKDK